MAQPIDETRKDYAAQLGNFLPHERVQHSINVATAARQLAERYHPELAEKAWVAGLLHDNGMGPLSLILYVADQTAADRDFDGVEELRDLARSDLVKAAAMVCRYKLMYLLAAGKPIVMETGALYNELQAGRRNADE